MFYEVQKEETPQTKAKNPKTYPHELPQFVLFLDTQSYLQRVLLSYHCQETGSVCYGSLNWHKEVLFDPSKCVKESFHVTGTDFGSILTYMRKRSRPDSRIKLASHVFDLIQSRSVTAEQQIIHHMASRWVTAQLTMKYSTIKGRGKTFT